MPGNATLWDVLPDGRLIIAHTDDRAVPDRAAPRRRERSRSVMARRVMGGTSRAMADGCSSPSTGQGGGPASAVYIRGMDGSPPSG